MMDLRLRHLFFQAPRSPKSILHYRILPMTSRNTLLTLFVFLLSAPMAWAKESAEKPLGLGLPEIFDKGGVVMILIVIGSIIGIALALERLLHVRKSNLAPKEFTDAVNEALKANSLDQAESICRDRKGALASILTHGFEAREYGSQAVEDAMMSKGAREVARLRSPIRALAVLATIQPLLGLLGTIFGMIGTFNALSGTSAADRVEELAPGIGQALYTTAAGLCAAIPCVILYHFLLSRVNRAKEEWNELGSQLVGVVRRQETQQGSVS